MGDGITDGDPDTLRRRQEWRERRARQLEMARKLADRIEHKIAKVRDIRLTKEQFEVIVAALRRYQP